LDWLEKNGQGAGLISDDAGRWAIPGGGFQPFVVDDPEGGTWSFMVDAEDWKPSIREAIDDFIRIFEGPRP
jgi:hypothetical protein